MMMSTVLEKSRQTNSIQWKGEWWWCLQVVGFEILLVMALPLLLHLRVGLVEMSERASERSRMSTRMEREEE